ncbi:MAG: hypothetical protein EBS53_00660 [Bacteroidetes bacterium]|nr:hypothetical protein [Bacteroidota bacterium]
MKKKKDSVENNKKLVIDSTAKKVHLAKLLPVALLSEHPNNSNVQSKHVFKELKESILTGGFDEPLIVVPRKEAEGYYVVSGNHRFKAGKEVGYEELPCIVREDWDSVEAEIQLVRRNYVRGQIDRVAFTESVNRLSSEQALGLDVIMERMGFEDADAFSEFYKQEKEKEKRMASQVSSSSNSAAQQVKMIDDLGVILSVLFEKYGNTVPNSFLVFPMGGKNHIFVQITPALKKSIDAVTTKCIADGMDINTALGGLLQIGIHHTNFFSAGKKPEVQEAGAIEGDANLNLLEK